MDDFLDIVNSVIDDYNDSPSQKTETTKNSSHKAKKEDVINSVLDDLSLEDLTGGGKNLGTGADDASVMDEIISSAEGKSGSSRSTKTPGKSSRQKKDTAKTKDETPTEANRTEEEQQKQTEDAAGKKVPGRQSRTGEQGTVPHQEIILAEEEERLRQDREDFERLKKEAAEALEKRAFKLEEDRERLTLTVSTQDQNKLTETD